MKLYYDIILECDTSPEEFFQIAREKNLKMETQLQLELSSEKLKENQIPQNKIYKEEEK